MSEQLNSQALSAQQIASAADALRWAAFGSGSRGLVFTYRQTSPERLHFETEYAGRKAWVDLDIPYTPLSLIVAGALLLQQLNTYVG
ncbi:hypothetical protein ACRQ84_21820 (plasmid) [Enterobacter ludwigii]